MTQTDISLAEVRARIDAIDAELLRLIDARAAIAVEVAAAKAAAAPGAPPRLGLRPAREAQLLRGLLARPRIAASPRLIIRLWRELIADSLLRQGPFALSVYPGADPQRTLELTRSRFGGTAPLALAPTPQAALAAARREGVVAIVSLDEAAPWWLRLLAEEALVVFDALPALAADGPPFALAVARTSLEPSGADRTFFVADTPLSAAEVEARLGEAGLAGELLRQAGGVKLFALAGFVAPGDERLMRVPGRLQGVVGAAPLPFDL